MLPFGCGPLHVPGGVLGRASSTSAVPPLAGVAVLQDAGHDTMEAPLPSPAAADAASGAAADTLALDARSRESPGAIWSRGGATQDRCVCPGCRTGKT
eukprot:CAMPEP_0197926712 /NCGR_PEP_ID=MMETSP1439-20131203/99561_1 /TAXON_ID=66791 /ORGANISM="Gonyaulax spinifera, Strain CCMP409" /LENGTH=97 /DNA_ID=CAMNT_0043549259 /DNA_START=337 /DNA_END=630 /DNA_ORIENTATION=-